VRIRRDGSAHAHSMDKYTLDTGTLSIAWLKADIMTVYKKDDNHLAENYRPI